jgi:hypothetical protein
MDVECVKRKVSHPARTATELVMEKPKQINVELVSLGKLVCH